MMTQVPAKSALLKIAERAFSPASLTPKQIGLAERCGDLAILQSPRPSPGPSPRIIGFRPGCQLPSSRYAWQDDQGVIGFN